MERDSTLKERSAPAAWNSRSLAGIVLPAFLLESVHSPRSTSGTTSHAPHDPDETSRFLGLVLALSAGAGTLAYVKLTRLATAQSTASELMGRVDAIGDLTAAVQSAALAEKNAIILSDGKAIAEETKKLVSYREAAAKAEAMLAQDVGSEDRRHLAEITSRLKRLYAVQDQVMTHAELNSDRRAVEIWDGETAAALDSFSKQFDQALAQAQRGAGGRRRRLPSRPCGFRRGAC